MNTDSFSVGDDNLPSLTRGNVRIEWSNLHEGLDGDYDQENPDDVNVLRFDVFKFDSRDSDWHPIDDGSYCTRVPATTGHDVLTQILTSFMDYIYDDVSAHGKAKRKCEQLSWTDLDGNIQINSMDNIFN
jgi:hypothetical protein